MNDYVDVTKNFSEVVPRIRGCKWDIQLKEAEEGRLSGYGREFELRIILWHKGDIVVSIYRRLHEDDSASKVQSMVSALTKDAEKLVSITPHRKGYYLHHAQYYFYGDNVWLTRANSTKVLPKSDDPEYRYSTKTEGLDNLRTQFEKMLEEVGKPMQLPDFITGGS